MRSIGFGLERLGLVAVARPRLMLVLILILMIVSIVGATRTRFADDMAAVFRSPDASYETYEAFRTRFVDGSEAAILLLDGDFSSDAHWSALQDLVADVEALGSAADVVSVLSLQRLEKSAGPVLPDAFETDIFDEPDMVDKPDAFDDADSEADVSTPAAGSAASDADTARDQDDAAADNPPDAGRLAAHPLNEGGRLLSADLTTAMLVITMPEDRERLEAARALVRDVDRLTASLPEGMSSVISGLPIVRAEIVEHLLEEHPFILAGGLTVGFVLGVILLGVVVDAIVVAVMPILSIVLIYGALGWLNIPMTVLLNDLPLLVLALAFAGNMHLVYAARRDLYASNYHFHALTRTIRFVGPACALASLTTMVAFLSLSFSGSEAIREFGLIGAASVLGVFFAAMVFFPVSAWVALTLGWRPRPALRGRGKTAQAIEALAIDAARILDAWRLQVTVGAVAITLLAGFAYSQVEPSYSYLEEVPRSSSTYVVMNRLETELGGAHALHLPLPIEIDRAASDLSTLLQVRDAHKAAETALDRPVFSPWTIVSWLTDSGRTASAPRLEAIFKEAPSGLTELFLSRDGTQPALVVRVPDEGNLATARLATRLEEAVGAQLGVDLTGQATGIVVLASRKSGDILARLGLSLVVAALGTSLLVGLGFRSAQVALLTLVPNILPVLAVGGVLYLMGQPLQIASALAMTIALGIAVDDTVHMVNGFRAYRYVRSPRAALAKTMRDVGPVLVLTSLVLMFGLAPALLSWSPGIGTFAFFAIATIGIALVTCVVALPAILALRVHPPGSDGTKEPRGTRTHAAALAANGKMASNETMASKGMMASKGNTAPDGTSTM